ncbi:hypothetical protein [Myxosarcina sp. GI1]|uniref:hypothetical protein n=1 Tax=Myxosarcina sp. GI1 TaxID=1541065 RepID=UPI00068EB217|nr:hypothetical protein [Myxosarcina sp. GI1]
MSQSIDKLDLLLERQFPPSNNYSSSIAAPQPPDQQSSDQQSPDDKQLPTEALLNRAIDTIMDYNDRANPEDKWYIGINSLKDIINSQVTIVRVVKRRKAEIDRHHQKHKLDRFHNRYYHREQSYTDFFDFS